MALQFTPIDEIPADSAALAEFLVGDEWPFHGTSRPSPETVEGWLTTGRLRPDWLSGDITPIEL